MSTTEDKPIPARFTTIAAKARDDYQGPIIPEGASQSEDAEDVWKDAEGVIHPPMPPERVLQVYRRSSEVPKNARARGQNVAGFGWDLEPVVKFDDPGLTKKARMYMYLDRIALYRHAIAAGIAAGADSEELKRIQADVPERPTDQEVETEIQAWRQRAEMEQPLLEIRLRNFCYEYSLRELVKRTEINRGGFGYAGWEIVRDATGTPVRAKLVEAMNLRPSTQDEAPLLVPWLRETSKVTYETIHVEKRFRRWVVRSHGKQTWYKEFGDPRVISRQTGKVFEDLKAFEEAKGMEEASNAKEATELLIWSEYSPGAEPCGMPIWHGHHLDVEAALASKQFDLDELIHGKIPRAIMSVIDGAMGDDVIERVKKFIQGGTGNRNRLAILQIATTAMTQIAGAGRAMFEFVNLSGAQHSDATHLELKKRSDQGVSQDFGNPPVLLGASENIQNRSVAETSQKVAEEQTYVAIREYWNDAINQHLIRPWGFRFWRFALKAPRLQQVEAVGTLLQTMIEQHVLRPDQVRPIAAELLGIELLDEPARWQKVPPKAAIAGQMEAFLETPDDPMTVENEQDPSADSEEFNDGETAAGLLEQLGMLATGFADGVAQKMRERIGLARSEDQISEQDMGEFWLDD